MRADGGIYKCACSFALAIVAFVSDQQVLSFQARRQNYIHHQRPFLNLDTLRCRLVRATPETIEEVKRSEPPWYSHPEIGRDRSLIQKEFNQLSDIFSRYREEVQSGNVKVDDENPLGVNISNGSRFFIISSKGMWHLKSSLSSSAAPLYLTAHQLETSFKASGIDIHTRKNDNSSKSNTSQLLVWVGSHQDLDYWVVYLEDDDIPLGEGDTERTPKFKSILEDASFTETENETERFSVECKPLREFGDSLEHSYDAGILATANGLVEFHKSHRFCSHCGGSTEPSKAGGSRTCTQEGCRRSVYPRIDSAAIMLVTSPCENFALLGRKRSWPSGRYSTLAGFCEVGETLEECCRRETYEESGVVVDPNSVRFVRSQPWPFPRSLMIGFRAKAMESGKTSSLPKIIVDTNEMEDIRWFKKHFVKQRLSLTGSTALTFQPNEMEKEFHIPGKASLARHLITEWANEE